MMMMMMVMIGSLRFFFFSFFWYMYMLPFGHTETSDIDDDMNDKRGHFSVFPSFFFLFFRYLHVPTLGTRYLPRGTPPRWGHICI